MQGTQSPYFRDALGFSVTLLLLQLFHFDIFLRTWVNNHKIGLTIYEIHGINDNSTLVITLFYHPQYIYIYIYLVNVRMR